MGLFPNTNTRRQSSASEDFSLNKRKHSLGKLEQRGRQRLGSLQLADVKKYEPNMSQHMPSTGMSTLIGDFKENTLPNSTLIDPNRTLKIPTSPSTARLNYNKTILNQLRVVWIPKWVDYSNK